MSPKCLPEDTRVQVPTAEMAQVWGALQAVSSVWGMWGLPCPSDVEYSTYSL